ncbi:LOW QUALITY PROTEIN: hypothetical protein Dda_6254 [Drechslerella dactyloides]|uniref:tRNA(Ile)-lysidine synthetase n=1 Tax=Drechslerella dactyloides TaxID=74499 RepID=A0AAD6IWR4_DREDA|nr:LOW QUALITY PROTEIN: hypothetical protein Dda_6254 [Drechslerella dactyloides]
MNQLAIMAAKWLLSRATRGATAVSPAEFAAFLGAAVTAGAALRRSKREVPERIALGVSGGVDSMALALLASKLSSFDNEFSRTQFVAVIIDHALRKGSADEADGVEAALLKLGTTPIQQSYKCNNTTSGWDSADVDMVRTAHTLAFHWAFDAKTTKALESLARQRRYRSFADVCAEFDIAHLVTAHHGDDQAETVLMRLLADSGVGGLAGIRAAAPVPECDSVFGADKITLLRPFLGVVKDRLRKTLEKERMSWFEDPTNRNPRLTPRNAIRALLAPTNDLPTPLRPTSLIALSERIAARNAQLADTVDWFLARCFLRHVREAGVIECFIPYNLLRFPPEFLARVVARLAEVISPLDRVDMTQMAKVVSSILTTHIAKGTPAKLLGLSGDDSGDDSWIPPQERGNIPRKPAKRRDFRRIEGQVQYAGGAITENSVFWEAAYCPPMCGRPEGVMLLCYRQPYVRASRTQAHDTPELALTPATAGAWQLWDGRFWIRFAGGPNHSFWDLLKTNLVRGVLLTGTRKEVMFRLSEVGLLGDADSKWKMREFTKRLKSDAPGKARSVLPVVCEVSKRQVKQWKEPLNVLAFPTFGVGVEGDRGGLWDWRPKRELVVGGRVIDRTPVMVADRHSQLL